MIILFIEFYARSGAPRGLQTELDILAAKYPNISCVVIGAPISILANTDQKYVFYSIEAPDLTGLIENPIQILIQFFRTLFRILKIARLHNINIIHCNHYNWSIYANPIGLFLHRPVIVHLKDTFLLQPKLARFLMKCNPNTKYIAVSKYVRKIFAQNYNLNKDKMIIIPDGVSPYIFRVLREKEIVKKNNSIEKIFVMISRTDPERFIEVFIDMAAMLIQKNPEFLFAHYGKTSDEKNKIYLEILKQRVKSLGIQENLKFYSYLNDAHRLARIYQKAYLTFVTAPRFALPNVAIESMMCATPVIAIDAGGNPEVITSENIGTLVAVNSPIAYAKAVEEFTTGKKNYVKTAMTAAQSVRQRFTDEQQGRRLVKLYQQL